MKVLNQLYKHQTYFPFPQTSVPGKLEDQYLQKQFRETCDSLRANWTAHKLYKKEKVLPVAKVTGVTPCPVGEPFVKLTLI